MGVSNYTPTGISHATSVDFSKRSVNQPVHIVQYDRTLPILAVSLYNNGQLYRLSETMEVSIRLGKPDRTFVYNKALGCDSTRTIVYFEITQQMSLFDGEYYPVIEIVDGEKIANSSTIYLVVDRNPVQHDYIESTIEYKELVDYRDEAVKAGNEAKESAKIAKDSVQTVVDKTKEAVEASETAVNASNSASESAESIIGVEENITRIGNMVSEKEPIITAAAETASTSAINAKQSETNANASKEASKLSETNSKQSETNAKASEEASKLSEINAKASEEASKLSETNAKAYADSAKVSETNAKAYADSIEEIAKASESYAHGGTGTREGEDTDNARYYMEQAKAVSTVDVATSDKAGIVKPDGTTITVDDDGTLHGQSKVEIMTTDKVGIGKPDGTTITVDDDGTLHGQSKVEIMTTDKVGIGKPDGTTITVDDDGTLHGQSKVEIMTGATAEANGTSGTVPAPTAGQESHILNGDGTWASPLDNAIISAKIEELNQAIENAKALKASLETYGMVQLNDTSVVTDSTGLALPATEKNPNLEGTLANQISQLNTDPIDYYNCNRIYSLDNIGNIIPSKLTTRLAISAHSWGYTKYLKIKILVINGNIFRPIFSYRLLQDYAGGSRVGILTVSKNYNYARYTDFYNNGSLEIKAGYTSDDYIEVYFKVPSYGVAFVDIDHSDTYGSAYDWEENIKNGNMSISLVDSVGAFTGGEYTLSNGV